MKKKKQIILKPETRRCQICGIGFVSNIKDELNCRECNTAIKEGNVFCIEVDNEGLRTGRFCSVHKEVLREAFDVNDDDFSLLFTTDLYEELFTDGEKQFNHIVPNEGDSNEPNN